MCYERQNLTISTALRARDKYNLQSKLDYILSEIRKRSSAAHVLFSSHIAHVISIIARNYSQGTED